jgi:two-component system osmolarity sensor histidine kinase EnvZ
MIPRWIPQTLFGQSLAVAIFTLIISQATTVAVMQIFYGGPLLQYYIEDRADHIETILYTLKILTPNERDKFIQSFDDHENARLSLIPPNPLELTPPKPNSRPALLNKLLDLHTHHKAEIMLRTQGSHQEIWIKLTTEKGVFWYVSELHKFDANFSIAWAFFLSINMIIIAILVYWLVKRINSPLEKLTLKAHTIALGYLTDPHLESSYGTKEIVALEKAFRKMEITIGNSEKNRTLMLAGVSHDLRTPLSRLRLELDYLETKHHLPLDPFIRDIEDINEIIDQFLNFARLIPEGVSNQQDFGKIILRCQEKFELRQYPVIFQDLIQTPLIPCDPIAIERVITNLVENALKYAKPPIFIAYGADAHSLWFSVRDHGPGVPPEQIPRLLLPFTRLHEHRSGPPGAGLGLAIVDGIVRYHQGTIHIQNLEPGLMFTITLSLTIP